MEATDKSREDSLGFLKMGSVPLSDLWERGVLDLNGRVWI